MIDSEPDGLPAPPGGPPTQWGWLMRALSILPFLLVLPLAGCGGDAPPAQSSSAQPAAPAVAPAGDKAPSGKPATDADLKPLLGTWALDPAQCGGQLLTISKTRFEGPGSGCDISGFVDNGNGSYTASMTCAASGQTSAERISMRPIFAPTGEGIDLIYIDRKNLASEVLRCTAP
jgi:hypothetical protein